MKKLGFLLVSLLLATTGWGQAVFNKFGPANGIQKNTGTTYQNTAAAASDVTGMYSGCTGLSTQYLAANNTCQNVSSAVSGANPTGLIGLTAVNGSATTYTRSDSTHALDQSIAPTWTGVQTFANTTANIVLNNSGGAADTKNTLLRESTAGFLFQSATDAAPTTPVTSVITAARTGAAWTGINFGNAADNPTYSFLGTGQTSITGGVVVGSATGGNKGAGTINAVGLYVGGVAVGTGGGSPGGSTGQLQYNNGGAFAGVGGSTFTAATQQLELIPSAGNITALKATSNGTNDVEIVASNAAGADAYFRAVDLSGVNWSIGNQRSTNNFVLANGVGLGSNPELSVSTSGVFNFGGVPTLNVNGTTAGWSYGGAGAGSAFTLLARYNAGSGGSDTMFYHSRGATVGTNTILTNNDETGSISFMGSDGTTTPVRTARIISLLDGIPSAGTSYPGRLEFYTVPSGSTSIALAMKLDSTQTMTVTAGINAGGSIGTVKNNVGGGIQLSAQNTDATSNGTFSQVLAANSSHSFHHLITGTAQTSAFITNGFNSEAAYLYTDSGVPLCIGTGGACRITITSGGDINMLAGTTNTLTVRGVSGQATLEVLGSSTSGSSFGPRVDAGSTSADYTMYWGNSATSVEYMRLFGDGGLVMNSATGGTKGAGSINAKAIYVNGVAVGANPVTARARVVSDGSSTCSISGTATGISSVSWASTGCTINFSASYFAATPICVVTPDTVTGGTEVVAKFDTTPSSSSTHAVVQNVSGGAAVGATMNIFCMAQ